MTDKPTPGNAAGIPARPGHRWAVVDVVDERAADRIDNRIVMTFRTWIGAHWMRWQWVRRHKRRGCWPNCSTFWHYEVKSLRRLSKEATDAT